MSEISTNRILDGITLALRAAYPEAQIESDTIEQGLAPSAFLVLLVSAESAPVVHIRYRRMPRFDILYFPKTGREECYATADALCSILEVITLPDGDRIRGTDMSFEITDGVLHFLVSYNHFVIRPAEETYMDELRFNQEGER